MKWKLFQKSFLSVVGGLYCNFVEATNFKAKLFVL